VNPLFPFVGPSNNSSNPASCSPESNCGCGTPLSRREAIKWTGLLAAAAAALPSRELFAGPFEAADFEKLVPSDKRLTTDWIASLTHRGEPEVLSRDSSKHVGMPVGGIACGQLYLGGDGHLWYWDIFGATTTTDYDGKIWAGPKYAKPVSTDSTVIQGFALGLEVDGKQMVRTLDHAGFSKVTFRGEYPIGKVTYGDDACPVEVHLEAFSPFIPLNVDDSALPATVLEFTVHNRSAQTVKVDLAGWLENAVCRGAESGLPVERRTSIHRRGRNLTVEGRSELKAEADGRGRRADVVFADFEQADYGSWRTEGDAFGSGPFKKAALPDRQKAVGFEGHQLVNTHRSSSGEDSEIADRYLGKLISPTFTIARRYIRFIIGGGKHLGKTGLQLAINGAVVRQATGENGNPMRHAWFDVEDLEGQQARLEIIDQETGGWGHTTLDQIVFTDQLPSTTPDQIPGFGSMALTLLDGKGTIAATTDLGNGFEPGKVFEALAKPHRDEAVASLKQKLVGAVGRRVSIAPGQSSTWRFVVTWFFPSYGRASGEMASIPNLRKLRRRYARRFADATSVAGYVAKNYQRLAGDTRRWNRTWYDSTLPYWFMDRTLVTVDCLATQTLHAFDDGRWWGWEGVDCCPGTCQHVWQYAQSVARLFPEIERDWRERVDFGLAWRESGAMDYRSESGREVAHDGFCGTIVRAYREHQMSVDAGYLQRVWPRVRKSLEFIMSEDRDADGILEGQQYNTLDAAWVGPMAWISSVYLAAVAAGEAMATEMNEPEFAAKCRQVADAGRVNLVKQLYNGEYFIHRPTDFKHTNTNDGCHIDQLLGQSFAFQVGLPRVVGETEAKSALKALWRYNFSPDIGVYRDGMKPVLPQGRWYAMPGEAGLLMCTWPRGGADKASGGGNPTFIGYFIECMTGFEYQVAAHMVWEGLVTEGLAVTRAIHDRYAPAKRNPYNEIECSDHYSRAMMSYGVFLAVCGYEYHGPKGHLGFAPRVSPENFRAPFTAAEGWGTLEQRRQGREQTNRVEVQWGRLRLRTLVLSVASGIQATSVTVRRGREELKSTWKQVGDRLELALTKEAVLGAEHGLQVTVRG
jgi:non-lysosomal glucosylceramidase